MIFLVSMDKKIVTNLRINRDDWLQLKSEAGELGMSVNEYINYLIRDLSARRILNPKKREVLFWKLGQLSKRVKSKPKGQLSDEDKMIYDYE